MPNPALKDTYKLYINGQWESGSADGVTEIRNPATGGLVAKATNGTKQDVEKAVKAAADAFPEWNRKTAEERADILYAFKALIEKHADHFAHVISSEMGKPLAEASTEVNFATGLIRFAAENTRRLEGDIIPGSRPGEKILFEKIPHGVIGAISAWNFPLALFARKVAPALAAGNTIVIKPHELAPLAALEATRLAEEAGIPAGVLNVVTGNGQDVGTPLVEHPDIKLITMTGSTATGKKIMAAAANTLKEVRLELGGKAPFIVMEDADIEKAASAAVQARFSNAGQVCTSNERTYVHEAVYNQFLTLVRQKIAALTVGNPLDAKTDMGPKVSLQELEKVHKMVEQAVAQGASLEMGGKRLTGGVYDQGFFYAPTLLTNVTENMDIVKDEVFGPVFLLTKVTDYDDALRQANECQYGLSAYVFTQDLKRIMRISSDLNFGEVYVNREGGEAPQGFHHGYKDSGLGGEDGKYGLEAYVQTKTVYLNA
ncbi:aldehyde dehydrogenase [Acetobacter cibinongensis]|uniref:Aldehyde dehydrogenase n=1 Tax=Acetobacter cibinongensis TaxID=146475 RepID=A0A1Z5YX15_9PROT|nr:aldehyde dehydrogenase [Acetobacter cibinongensis]OUJ03733.1 aldehyde dehydrogenase [Acetobacter cibinongensis]